MILADSNVIIDVLSRDQVWQSLSEAALTHAADHDDTAINPIIYAEIAAGFETMRDGRTPRLGRVPAAGFAV